MKRRQPVPAPETYRAVFFSGKNNGRFYEYQSSRAYLVTLAVIFFVWFVIVGPFLLHRYSLGAARSFVLILIPVTCSLVSDYIFYKIAKRN